ncbi:hypothetical protein ABW20_dc0109940 [Dactylellina cionopaga]|nr:hypothetical protein ABW20_dc0109940 [Dactylellina cionopaga]
MHMKISASVAFAILNMVPSISGHGCFIQATGDSGGGAAHGLGVKDNTPRNGVVQPGFQRDIAVFSSPAVPWTKPWCPNAACCKKGNCWSKNYYTPVKRTYMPNGCGVTLYNINRWAELKWPKVYGPSKNGEKNVRWYQQPVNNAALINVNAEVSGLVKTKKIPRARAGGWIRARLHQVNQDGGGAYKCKLDLGGTGQKWAGGWLTVTANIKWWKKKYNNIPGNKYSVNGLKLKKWDIIIHLPKNLQCSGAYAGMTNICLIRCENTAVNGPFGGCIPFQQFLPPAPAPKPKPVPKPAPKPAPPITVTVTNVLTSVQTKEGNTQTVTSVATSVITKTPTVTETPTDTETDTEEATETDTEPPPPVPTDEQDVDDDTTPPGDDEPTPDEEVSPDSYGEE